MGNKQNTTQVSDIHYFQFTQEAEVKVYRPGTHPGQYLLPASELLKYPNLPKSVKKQMNGSQNYKIGGKSGKDTVIDRPDGKASISYQKWLLKNRQISSQIHSTIMENIDKTNRLTFEEMVGRSSFE